MEAQSASQQEAIRALLNNLEELSCDFSRDAGVTLAPLVAACISEPAARDAGWLIDVFESFGWDGNTFTRPVDVRAFASRVKALMFDGLQQKGQGSYATVYKVCNDERAETRLALGRFAWALCRRRRSG